MALASQGFELTVTLVDSGENKSTKRYQLNSADFATATTDAGAVLAALDAVTDAVIISYNLTERFEDHAASAPNSGEQVENLALVTVRDSVNAFKYHTFTIPAPNIGIFVGDSGDASNIVDTGDTALTTYADMFNDPCYISDGENSDGNGAVKGKRIHRGSRKG